VKTAFAGGDPLGRIFAAAGRSGVKFDTALVDIRWRAFGAASRQPLDFNERAASTNFSPKRSAGRDLHVGQGQGSLLDLRLHRGVCSHQRLIPHLAVLGFYTHVTSARHRIGT